MNAVEFLIAKKKMCDSFSVCSGGCPLAEYMEPDDMGEYDCLIHVQEYPHPTVEAVEKWAAENPKIDFGAMQNGGFGEE